MLKKWNQNNTGPKHRKGLVKLQAWPPRVQGTSLKAPEFSREGTPWPSGVLLSCFQAICANFHPPPREAHPKLREGSRLWSAPPNSVSTVVINLATC